MKPPTDAMLRAMLELQGRMNRKINPDWLGAGYEFLRAVLVEAVEALEHMMEILARLGPTPRLADQLYGELERKYRSVTGR